MKIFSSMMNLTLAYILLAVLSTEALVTRGDIAENEFTTTSPEDPGAFMEIFFNHSVFLETIATKLRDTKNQLTGATNEYANEVITFIRNKTKSETCLNLRTNLVKIERFVALLRIQDCMTDAFNSVEHPIDLTLQEIHENIKNCEANDPDGRIAQQINELNRYETDLEMKIEKLISGIENDQSNCIHQRLEDFSSSLNVSILVFDKCLNEIETPIMSFEDFFQQLAGLFENIINVIDTEDYFTTDLKNLVLSEEMKMNIVANQAINCIRNVSKDEECLESATNDVYINRFLVSKKTRDCEENAANDAFGNFGAMVITEDHSRTKRYPFVSSNIEIAQTIREVRYYVDNLKNGKANLVPSDKIALISNSLHGYINSLKNKRDELISNVQKPHHNCFHGNLDRFKSSLDEICANAKLCSAECEK